MLACAQTAAIARICEPRPMLAVSETQARGCTAVTGNSQPVRIALGTANADREPADRVGLTPEQELLSAASHRHVWKG